MKFVKPSVYICFAIIFLVGCASPAARRVISTGDGPGLTMVDVKPWSDWIPTGVMSAIETLTTVTAGGSVEIAEGEKLYIVSPPGLAGNGAGEFPNAPAYALLGRIGEEGKPFVVGEFRRCKAGDTGELFLKINAPLKSEPTGEYLAAIHTMAAKSQSLIKYAPTSRQRLETLPSPGKQPENNRVLWYYIDGARPDVMRRMVAEGALPNIRRIFFEGGVEFPYAFTQFPSETISSNATLRTGVGSATHGVKAPIAFNRRSRRFIDRLSHFGPVDTANFIRAHSLFAHIGVALGAQPKGGPLGIYDYLSWGRYLTGAIPVHPEGPDLFWAHFAVNRAELLQIELARLRIDEITAAWGLEDGIPSKARLVEVWVPETDSVSHVSPRGQFGRTRAILAKADFLLGALVARLAEQGELEQTTIFLFSDHGHTGGDAVILKRYDIANELFFRPVDSGGLGMNIAQHQYIRQRKGKHSKCFVYMPVSSEGFCNIFMARGSYFASSLADRNNLSTLMNYETPAGKVNMVSRLLNARASGAPAQKADGDYPVDMVIIPTGVSSGYLATRNRGWAVIERKETPEGIYYRYETIAPPVAGETGEVGITRKRNAKDPLGYIGTPAEKLMGEWRRSRAWLHATANLDRPDAVPAMGEYVSLIKRIRGRGADYMPDMVAVAAGGWFFGYNDISGTTHGHPNADCMVSAFYMAGPSIPRGAIIEQAIRLYDILPTTLEILGVEYDEKALEAKSVFGLDAPPLAFSPSNDSRPSPARLEFERKPAWPGTYVFLRDPENPWDLHNVLANVLSVTGNSVVRLTDEAGPAKSVKKNTAQHKARQLLWTSRPPASNTHRHGRSFVRALRMDKWSVGDTVLTAMGRFITTGNLMRVGRVVDWTQDVFTETDKSLAKPFGLPSVIGTPLTNPIIDGTQEVVWWAVNMVGRVLYRFADEVVITGIEKIGEALVNAGGPREDKKE